MKINGSVALVASANRGLASAAHSLARSKPRPAPARSAAGMTLSSIAQSHYETKRSESADRLRRPIRAGERPPARAESAMRSVSRQCLAPPYRGVLRRVTALQATIGPLQAEARERARLGRAGQLGYAGLPATFTPSIPARSGVVNSMPTDCKMPW